ncbi:WAT1-related protein At5g47470-like [Lotus japonicus]|uniref:WAT1-related protein n=1 Tax=Lotus japonicus TaxID=34305 RepID=I3SJC6_LOTJA|nr:WAT1-related protein At5g47470-like [Lotus japonicus]AFK40368.1 unknown [Lotus japonicus]
MVVGVVNGRMMEDIAIIGGLIGVQVLYAGSAMLLGYLMSLGIKSLTIVIFTSFATFLLLLPFAFYYERSKWPKQFSLKLLIQFIVIALASVVFQSLFLKGINLTSPAMGTAMPNLAPGLIFIIAWIFRMEKVDLRCTYSRVKIIGTLLCVVGAVAMSMMQSLSTSVPIKEGTVTVQLASPPPVLTFDRDKIFGCIYLLVAIIILSSSIVLQAFTLGDFPAPMSLCVITSFLAGSLAAVAQLVEDHQFSTGWPIVSVGDMVGYGFLSGAVSGICLSFNGWALEKRGPVLVSMFSPIGTVCSVVFSAFTIGDTINIGSFAGMVLMFTGLYFVLWAKGKEGYSDSEFDAEKPLLS